ncbi:inositol monophosphatase family protein [Kitasatospora viridis]|uniref:3'(2'), 5'-bisphosphate nucleotidase n=1 Tax=Kitasatospora viridis TaxID=281105 RepID=A0A561UDB9_9ACTN|nr:inositol monophosphatase family protein [Kitasatospora viridis]TWF97364.1 3'(2'), 5'-bisphosphate nucleotidase [Kitasatospora viridis]
MITDTFWSDLEERLLPLFTDYRDRLADLPVHLKADHTLLTEADVAAQSLIVQHIRGLEPDAVIIAEEDERSTVRDEVAQSDGRVWVIDPIDGTAEFVQQGHSEFCSVVCLLEDWRPSAAFVLAPELGAGRSPLRVTADVASRTVRIGGRPAPMPTATGQWISATRSAGTPPRVFDSAAERAGYRLKLRTTSQTVDMLRTAIDLGATTDPPLPSFDLFWRRKQKLWDGAAGIAIGTALGLRSADEHGEPLPFGPEFLSAATPTFESSVMGHPEAVAWFLDVVHA